MDQDNAESIEGKVFDTDSNGVAARLLIWGPEDVDGEQCVIVEPTDFHAATCEPNPHYDGQSKPIIAADDLRLAIPIRLFTDGDIPACPECGSEDVSGRGEVWECGKCGDRFRAPVQVTTDAAALDQLAALLNRPGEWNGGDVCEALADTLVRTGREIDSHAPGDCQ